MRVPSEPDCSRSSGPRCGCTSRTVANFPTGLIAANESVVMSEVTYVYTSAIREVMPSGVTLTQKYYLKPRLASEVLWSNN